MSTLPGEIRLSTLKIEDTPEEPLQNSTTAKPRATVGITKGISAKLSMIVVMRLCLLTINQAKGTPASTSNKDTKTPITKDHATASIILWISETLNVKFERVASRKTIPAIAGVTIISRKNTIAAK